MAPVATLVWFSGVLGIVYTLIVIRRARHARLYKPVLEDWIWHTALPLVAYVVMVASAGVLLRTNIVGLFGVAASVVLLLFVGIHNAWDSVIYIAISAKQAQNPAENAPPSAKPK
jgi:hypothetical protein